VIYIQEMIHNTMSYVLCSPSRTTSHVLISWEMKTLKIRVAILFWGVMLGVFD